MAQKSKNAPRETELPSEEQRVTDNGSRNHRGEVGRVEKRPLGVKRGWRALHRTRVFIPLLYTTLHAFLDSP